MCTRPELDLVPVAEAILELIPETSSQAAQHEPVQSFRRLIDSVGE